MAIDKALYELPQGLAAIPEAPPIEIEIDGFPTEGLFPQKYKIVSGDIIVLINSPLQSINEMV